LPAWQKSVFFGNIPKTFFVAIPALQSEKILSLCFVRSQFLFRRQTHSFGSSFSFLFAAAPILNRRQFNEKN